MTVVVDGRTVRSYTGAFESAGRVYAPLRPFVTTIADAMWFDGDSLIIVRDGRSVIVRIPSREPDALDHAYVPLAAVLRSLGEIVEYQPFGRIVVRSPYAAVVTTATPYNGSVPSAAPSAVFTPAPVATPRPVWTGSALPRRTPLPYPTPRA